MNTNTSRILVAILAVFTIVMVSSIAYHFLNKEYVTETAIMASADDSISFKGIFIRNEQVVTYSGTGVINYCVPDSGKLGKGSEIAEIYQSDNDIEIKQKIENLTHEKELLEKIKNPGTSDIAQPSFLSDVIAEKYKSAIYSLEENDIETIKSDKEELLVLLSTMQMVTGDSEEYRANINQRISDIDTQITELQSSQSAPINTVVSDRSAYFISHTDGYEETLNKDSIDTLTADYIKSVNNNKKSGVDGVLGKLIDGYEWYMAGVIDNSKNKYSETENVTLKFESTSQTVSAVINKIKPTDNPKESIIILSCDKLTYDLVQNRTEHVEMVKGIYEGVKIPRKAIRFKNIEETVTDEATGKVSEAINNYRGVYVKLGEQILFKKLDVIFEGDDFVISEKNAGEEYVQLYDDIIVEGIDANGN